MKLQLAPLIVAASFCPLAAAVQILPSSYTAPNGYTSTYNYWDESYSGSGCKTCDGALLSGGLGDLADGVIPTQNWLVTEPPGGPGPYVGWLDINPTLTFEFGSVVNIDTVVIHFDDSGAGSVSPPLNVVLNGSTYPVANPPGTEPFAFTVPGLTLAGSQIQMTFERGGRFTFASEVQFFSSTVPEVAPWQALLAGVAILGVCLRRREAAAA